MIFKSFVILVISTILCSSSADDSTTKTDRSELKRSVLKSCGDSYSLKCLQIDAIYFVDKLNENEHISLFPGVSLVRENKDDKKTTGNMVADLAREFSNDPNARLNGFLLKKITGFLNTHSLKLNLWNPVEEESVGTARKKNKKGDGGMGMILAFGAMLKGMMMTLALGGLAAIAGKALMTSLISFMLSAIIGLKGMSSRGGGHSTYEVIAKPTHSHSHDGWDRGFAEQGRNLESFPLPLALQLGP